MPATNRRLTLPQQFHGRIIGGDARKIGNLDRTGRSRRIGMLGRSRIAVLLVSFIVMLITLSIVPDIKDVFALPMLIPISLLATASLSTLRRGAANALDWFGIMTFALLAIALWWGWAGLLLNNNAWITHQLKDFQPGLRARLPRNFVLDRITVDAGVDTTGVARRPFRAPLAYQLGRQRHPDVDTLS